MGNPDRISDTRTKLLAMLAVVALHVLFLFVIQRMRTQLDVVAFAEAALVMVRIQRPRMPELERTPEPERERVEEARSSSRDEQQAPAAATSIDPAAPSVPSPPRQVDWRANAARSAQVVVEGSLQEGHRSFGPRENAEPGDPAAPSVFGTGPKHKFGDVDSDAHGDPVVWMNDKCYTTLDKRVQTARDWVKANPGQFAGPEIVCLPFAFGRREPDGTLFEHIKKREEPPAPKAGTEMNALPEREQEK